MSRENADERGRRYLHEGRLIVRNVDERRIVDACRGSGAVHKLGWSAGGGWYCDCPAFSRCAHLVALQSVVAVPKMAR